MKVPLLSRRNAGRLVLVAWAVSLAWLANRQLGKTDVEEMREATTRLNPESHYYAVRAGGIQLGYASLTVDTVPEGFRLSEVMTLDLGDGDPTRRATRRTDIFLTPSLRLKKFARLITGRGLFEEFVGQVEGDTVIRMTKQDARGGPKASWSVTIPGDAVLPIVLPYRLAFGHRLEVGRVATANVLDLTTGTISRIQFSSTAESTFVVSDSAITSDGGKRWQVVRHDSVKAFRIEYAAADGPIVSWVDERGGIVRMESAFGVRLERQVFEMATLDYRGDSAAIAPEIRSRLGGSQSLLASGRAPEPAPAAVYAIHAENVERFLLPKVSWLAGGRQAMTETHQLSVGGEGVPNDSTKIDYLDPDHPMPIVDPIVAKLADSLLTGLTDPAAKIRAVMRWIKATIVSDTSVGAPTLAASVLERKAAGADGKAGLFVDLANAAGIRSRLVTGVAVLGDREYGHAWAEVRLDDRWVAVDPTFNQMPASAQLVRIRIGGSSRAIDLLPVLGSARFERTDH